MLNLLAKIFIKNETEKLKIKLQELLNKYILEKNEYTTLMKSVLIIGEDHRYFSHNGVDPIAILRILWKRFRYSIIEGGSTIEQQLVRTITGNYDKKISRKIREILLASTLSSYLSKNDIACLYLKCAYFGWDLIGLKKACNILSIPLDTNNITEAASVISRLKYPQPKQFSLSKYHKIYRRTLYIRNRYEKLSTTFIKRDKLL